MAQLWPIVRKGVPPRPGARNLEKGGPALAAEHPLVVGPGRSGLHVPVVLSSDNLKIYFI